MWKIYKDNNRDLDFVLNCLFCQSINLNEMSMWIDKVIETSVLEKIPDYVFELSATNFDKFNICDIYEIIGFVTDGQFSKYDLAIYGIAFLRGFDVFDSPVSKEQALQALEENPHILDEFRRFFPFIEI